MLTVTVTNQTAFLWKAEDWETLRKEYRIVGNLNGSLANLPRQDSFLGLPATLLPEETTLLLEKKIVRLASYPSLCEAPSENIKKIYFKYKEDNHKEQIEHYETERKRQVSSMIDRIIEGKRKKSLTVNAKKAKGTDNSISEELVVTDTVVDTVLDREEILNNELSKGVSVTPAGLLVQTFTSDQWIQENESQVVDWNFPSTHQDKLRYNTFKDLWEKGYYISSGEKFGGDFLVYPGDPIKFHSQFIVSCVDSKTSIPLTDVIAYSRLGSTTRKTFVIATQLEDSDDIVYQSLQWNDKT